MKVPCVGTCVWLCLLNLLTQERRNRVFIVPGMNGRLFHTFSCLPHFALEHVAMIYKRVVCFAVIYLNSRSNCDKNITNIAVYYVLLSRIWLIFHDAWCACASYYLWSLTSPSQSDSVSVSHSTSSSNDSSSVSFSNWSSPIVSKSVSMTMFRSSWLASVLLIGIRFVWSCIALLHWKSGEIALNTWNFYNCRIFQLLQTYALLVFILHCLCLLACLSPLEYYRIVLMHTVPWVNPRKIGITPDKCLKSNLAFPFDRCLVFRLNYRIYLFHIFRRSFINAVQLTQPSVWVTTSLD